MSSSSAEDQPSSLRQILRSSYIIGGASAISIVAGIARMKVAALVLGPAGIGLIGLFQSLVTTAQTLSSVGIGVAGTRQVAAAATSERPEHLAASRRALLRMSIVLALIGSGAFWLVRHWIAYRLLDDADLASAVGWLSIGVGLGVISGAFIALLTGMRRIGDVARAGVLGSGLSTIGAIIALLWFGEDGILAFVLLPFAALPLAGLYYVLRLPQLPTERGRPHAVMRQLRTMLRLGAAFMVGSLAMLVGPLIIRLLIQRGLGIDELGQFQAAWTVSTTYLGFALGAMATDYFSRLSGEVSDHEKANRLVNEQTQVALLLAGPILVAVLGAAPWLLRLLYSSAFVDAAALLRWQTLGDVLKLASWPLGFLILALGRGKTFIGTESFAMLVFVFVTWIGLPIFGVNAAGIGFLAMYAFYLPLIYWLARRATGFRWSQEVGRLFVALVCACGAVAGASMLSEWAALAVGMLFALSGLLYALVRLRDALPHRLAVIIPKVLNR